MYLFLHVTSDPDLTERLRLHYCVELLNYKKPNEKRKKERNAGQTHYTENNKAINNLMQHVNTFTQCHLIQSSQGLTFTSGRSGF